jgi:hypothetical protein
MQELILGRNDVLMCKAREGTLLELMLSWHTQNRVKRRESDRMILQIGGVSRLFSV